MGARRSTLLAGALLLLLLLLLWPVSKAEGNSVHIHYFETIDASLETDLFRIFTVAAHQHEQITIVAYGLDGNLQPEISVLSPDGMTLIEDRNLEQQPVAMIQFIAPQTGSYPFLVRRQNTAQGGMLRLMIFEGQPLSENMVIQDTADPHLPGRAFLVAGNASAPVQAAVAVLPEASSEAPEMVYAARGSSFTPPPASELSQPVQYLSWVNDQTTFYTISVSTNPGLNATSAAPINNPLDFQLTINEGGEVVRLERPVCEVALLHTTAEVPVHAGPGPFYMEVDRLPAGQTVEITGIDPSGTWLQIADPDRLVGTSWIGAATVSHLQAEACKRISTVAAPPPTEAIIQTVAHDPSDASLLFMVQAYADDPVGFTTVYQQVQAQLGTDLISDKKEPLLQAILDEADLAPEQEAAFMELVAVEASPSTGIAPGTALDTTTSDKDLQETVYMETFAQPSTVSETVYTAPPAGEYTAAPPPPSGDQTAAPPPPPANTALPAPSQPEQPAPPPSDCDDDCEDDDDDDHHDHDDDDWEDDDDDDDSEDD